MRGREEERKRRESAEERERAEAEAIWSINDVRLQIPDDQDDNPWKDLLGPGPGERGYREPTQDRPEPSDNVDDDTQETWGGDWNAAPEPTEEEKRAEREASRKNRRLWHGGAEFYHYDGGFTGKCGHCGKIGHMKMHCPKKRSWSGSEWRAPNDPWAEVETRRRRTETAKYHGSGKSMSWPDWSEVVAHEEATEETRRQN